jgi:nicotinate-nucleotide pyrophosphorylase (carboxylating)
MADDTQWLVSPYPLLYEELVRGALQEDLGRAGDLTTDAIVLPADEATAMILARKPGRIAGLEVAISAFRHLDPRMKVELRMTDGQDAGRGEHLAMLRGNARALLSAERTALNLLGHLSGIATATRDVAAAVAPHGARVVCTRKTTPGMRALEKYAVRAGGGANHRFGLDDGVLVKDNHRLIAGGITEAVRRVRSYVGHMVKIQVEADTIEELEEALALDVDAVLLDNMDLGTLSQAVSLARGRAMTEASGGITPATAAAVAATGVNLLSMGWLTHSSPSLDVSLDLVLRV